MSIHTMRGSDNRGVYCVYWEQEAGDTNLIIPGTKKDNTPDKVKLMILESLLDDLKIPIRIDEFKREQLKR